MGTWAAALFAARAAADQRIIGTIVAALALLLAAAGVRGTMHLRRAWLSGQPRSRRWVTDLVTVWGAGYLSKGGGTLGSVAALPVAWVLSGLPLGLRLALVGVISGLSIWAVQRYLAACAEKDPSEVVIDETVGVLLALAVVPWGWPQVIVAVVVFRLLDIFKPWPICQTERAPGALGVMLDDLVAGLLAGVLVVVLLPQF